MANFRWYFIYRKGQWLFKALWFFRSHGNKRILWSPSFQRQLRHTASITTPKRFYLKDKSMIKMGSRRDNCKYNSLRRSTAVAVAKTNTDLQCPVGQLKYPKNKTSRSLTVWFRKNHASWDNRKRNKWVLANVDQYFQVTNFQAWMTFMRLSMLSRTDPFGFPRWNLLHEKFYHARRCLARF